MAKWIIVVDDDTANLKMAGHILSKNNMRVTALKSGSAFLEYVDTNGMPDLVLLDIKMPVMDGFETLGKLRQIEQQKGLMKTPVIFLTADEDVDTETRGFEVGVSDFIRKPFNPDVLLRRIDNIMSNSQEMQSLKSEATIDKLTGLLNKGATGVELSKTCSNSTGCLMMIDLDSFKLVNDLYGHEMGDKVLIACADIIRSAVPSGSKCGRIGGDEFTAFALGVTTEKAVAEIAQTINDNITRRAKELMGEDMSIPLGASIGGIFVPRFGNDYNSLLKLADKALYIIKKNGKHGYGLYDDDVDNGQETSAADIHAISEILGERSIHDVALQLDKDSFSPVYRYVIRYIMRHHINACKVLFTLSPENGTADNDFYDGVDEFGNHIRESLRKSDIFMRNSKNQYFVFLTDIRADSVGKVISHIMDPWNARKITNLVITYESEFIGSYTEPAEKEKVRTVVVVDDDVINLQVAGKILSSGGLHVVALRSGEALFEYLDKEAEMPSLILLDVKMPGMGGFDAIKKLHSLESAASKIPVIFLTADESEGSEREGLQLGAMDFIRKPFVPEVLLLRVNNLIQLVTLQKQLYFEVEQKTKENKALFLQAISCLAAAIDTKDVYTKGHSSRVAEYSRMIAKRLGFSDERQDEIYMIAILHDVGKIGIPISVLNKMGKLTEEEYALVKKHSEMGASILQNIESDPKFALGAKHHHERYDGTGYPDRLSGSAIPEEARIIAVADAYDAMSSDRIYRTRLTQEMIKDELKSGSGRQFDPHFAEIMLEIIEEDKEYKYRG
ncbi:GGDEF/HDGYP domain-containing response regulator [Butyrivibrio sp. AE2032]|uniref:GGDEF/HDGYP domain-containing response regulator n=1 Tax=Butyrivibrio sp. AE2032 TaxID=1458463 RepID=UPI00068B4E09|nr:response regulator [Butyrivibrio sp. AE2032]